MFFSITRTIFSHSWSEQFTNFSSFWSLLGKLSESDNGRASSPTVKLTPLTNTKKVMALVDYDADSDESVSSPKKQKPNVSKLEKEEAASIVVETPGSES